MAAPKRIAFFVFPFPRLTLLDLIGAYDALRRIAAMSIDSSVTHRIIGTEAEIVDESGLMLKPDAVYEDLSGFNLLHVAGGLGTVALDNRRAIDYLKTWGDERPLASVCSGALLLGRAGYLRDKRATTHHLAVELLRPLCREVVTNRRVVDEGRVVTAGGVSSSLDLGLYLVEKYWGTDARVRIANQMEYRGYSPA
jgi:transcriptional regulator GlxA family with amidase domain